MHILCSCFCDTFLVVDLHIQLGGSVGMVQFGAWSISRGLKACCEKARVHIHFGHASMVALISLDAEPLNKGQCAWDFQEQSPEFTLLYLAYRGLAKRRDKSNTGTGPKQSQKKAITRQWFYANPQGCRHGKDSRTHSAALT